MSATASPMRSFLVTLRYNDVMPPQQTEDKSEVQAITIRLPKDMYEDLRRQAFDERTSINALIVEAVRVKQS